MRKLPIFGLTTPDAVLEELANGKQQKVLASELGVHTQSFYRAIRVECQRRGARDFQDLLVRYCLERKKRG